MHNNLLKPYMDKEKATIDNIMTCYCKILTRKVETLNAIEPDRTFGLDYIFGGGLLQEHSCKTFVKISAVR